MNNILVPFLKDNASIKVKMYVLLTTSESYFVEYLLGQLVLSDSIENAMVFDEEFMAQKFKTMLYKMEKLETSVNTFISAS